MYKVLKPTIDATIYEKTPTVNSGIDQILELNKHVVGEQTYDKYEVKIISDDNYASRILIKFDNFNEISGSQFEAYLNLRLTEIFSVPYSYEIHVHPLTQEWQNGNGNAHDNPPVTNGVTWVYTDENKTPWNPQTYYVTTPGGGSWDESVDVVAYLNNSTSDLRINVTEIVEKWVNNEIPNYGFIIKFSNNDEASNKPLGTIKYFSKETHTIYQPTLEIYTENSQYSGSFINTPYITNNYYIRSDIRKTIKFGSIIPIRLQAFSIYSPKRYETETNPKQLLQLPEDSCFSIVDYSTNTTLINYNDIGTKVLKDDQGDYIILDTNSLFKNRYYKIVFKIKEAGFLTTFYEDEALTFGIE